MKRTYFITGTDTGVGKTYIAAKLLESMSEEAGTVGYIKPFQTGCIADCGGRFVAPDADEVKAHLGEKVECHVLRRYKLPACPLLAAQKEGATIDFNAAVEWTRQTAGKYQAAVVEGAGGLEVPITERETMLDFASSLRYPVILVAANRLGCINHTLLSVDALRGRGLNIEAIFLNYTEPADPGETERGNADMIRTFAPGLEVITIDYGGSLSFR